MDHSIVLYLVSRLRDCASPYTHRRSTPSYTSIHSPGKTHPTPHTPTSTIPEPPPHTPKKQIGPDGSFLDFFTQSMQPPDIVQRIKRYLAQATRVTK